jgi:hypothetical protein
MYSIAHSFAELAGRTRPDIHDLEQAFSDMNLRPSSLNTYIKAASQSSKCYFRLALFSRGILDVMFLEGFIAHYSRTAFFVVYCVL